MRKVPRAGEFYRHFKGNLYQVLTVAKHSETGEALVIYQALYGSYGVYARPLEMFLSKVDREKYPQAEQEYRFEEIKMQEQAKVAEEKTQKQPVAEKTTMESRDVTEQIAVKVHETKEPMAAEARPGWDAGIEEFLDAGSYQERLRIFTGMQHRLTDDMIDIMAVSMDTEVNEKELSERIQSLKNFLLTQVKFESDR